ncbi:MAG: DNA topoisomerase IV subunit B [Rickettsiales bacterium]
MELFSKTTAKSSKTASAYNAEHIEVLEGLEPVRKRPGMYIGGTDEKALYHLINEVLDNSMDEAVAGHATTIKIHLSKENTVTISDNGRGIPVDKHPKFPSKSALEVILTMLHSGGKFSDKVYATSGGLHGVGISVVNALSDIFNVEVKREGKVFRQEYSKGLPQTKLKASDGKAKETGTSVTFHPDPEIFKKNKFHPENIYKLACSKAYLFKGVAIQWSCDKETLPQDSPTPQKAIIHYPNGLQDFLISIVPPEQLLADATFAGEVEFPDEQGKVEWAISWLRFGDSITRSYCNTIHTAEGGTHEAGLRSALLKGLRAYADITNNKKASQITSEDVLELSVSLLSVFIKNPSFQGQTKEKLLTHEATKLVDNAVKHQFDHWLTGNPKVANDILALVIQNSEDRLRRKKEKEVARKNPIKSMRLPGKLADCNQSDSTGTELFLVEGESAGGSAKQGRDRERQAILPLKGKILNVASNSMDKIKANQEIADLMLALGCGVGANYNEKDLRYEKIIIMTDADVDGSHISSLLMTFFYLQMPELIRGGHLYLAQPPLYRITQGAETYYAQNDVEKEKLIAKLGKKTMDVGRFKGLGEMTAKQLKETTMDPKKRTLLKVMIANENEVEVAQLVENLMGRNPEPRFLFIKERTETASSDLKDLVDLT